MTMASNTSISSTKIKDLLKKNKVFNDISQEHINEIIKYSTTIQKEKKEFIFMQGEEATDLYIVIEGIVAMFSETSHGQEVFINIASSGDIIGETALLTEFPYSLNTQALSQIFLLKILATKIKNLLQKNSVLAFNFLTNITHLYCKLTAKMERNATLMAPQRLGCFLLKSNQEKLSNGKTKIIFPYEKRVIASYLQMTPETFSRSVLYMEKYGVKTHENSIIIDDIDVLKKFSCSHCTKLSDQDIIDCSIYTK